MIFRQAIDHDAQDLAALAARAADSSGEGRLETDLLRRLDLSGSDWKALEERLDGAAMKLRRDWLALAHRPADHTLKSPCSGTTARVPSGATVSFGYERELDVSSLEARSKNYSPASELVLFRSGQAALATLLLYATGKWSKERALTVAHVGAYFETRSLIASWSDRVLRAVADDEDADIVIAEPVWCNGAFGCPRDLPRARRLLLIDTTMVGPGHDLQPYLKASDGAVIAYHSALKLDEAGLELANAGVVRLLQSDETTAADLRKLRALTASGLSFDEMAALSAPWFLDRTYVDSYAAAIFANNRALAEAVGQDSPRFAPDCHPALVEAGANAPFCALRLREPTGERYQALVQEVAGEVERRGLLAAQGGSFGFRGHRFELIEPEPGAGETFLRVAMGWREGFSRDGLCELFGELGAQPGR